MLRILHIVSNISLRSGVMSFLMSYQRNINTNYITFDYLYYEERNTATYQKEIEKFGGHVYKVASPVHFTALSRDLERIKKELIYDYDIVHLHEPFLTVFFQQTKALFNAKKFIAHAHSIKFSDHWVGDIRNRLVSVPNRWLVDAFAACSQAAGVAIFGNRFTKTGIIINNAIDINKFSFNNEKRIEVRKKLNLEDSFVVGHVGNFTRPKNHEFIIQVFFEVYKLRSNARLILVGDGENREKIQELCKTLGIVDRVNFMGVRNDVEAIMLSFDRMLFPSKYEGLGITLIEAQASGLPCIYSDTVPIDADIMDFNNHRLSLKCCAKKWAEAVIDPSLKLIPNSKTYIQAAGYDIKKAAEHIPLVYDEILRKE